MLLIVALYCLLFGSENSPNPNIRYHMINTDYALIYEATIFQLAKLQYDADILDELSLEDFMTNGEPFKYRVEKNGDIYYKVRIPDHEKIYYIQLEKVPGTSQYNLVRVSDTE